MEEGHCSSNKCVVLDGTWLYELLYMVVSSLLAALLRLLPLEISLCHRKPLCVKVTKLSWEGLAYPLKPSGSLQSYVDQLQSWQAVIPCRIAVSSAVAVEDWDPPAFYQPLPPFCPNPGRTAWNQIQDKEACVFSSLMECKDGRYKLVIECLGRKDREHISDISRKLWSNSPSDWSYEIWNSRRMLHLGQSLCCPSQLFDLTLKIALLLQHRVFLLHQSPSLCLRGVELLPATQNVI